MSKKVFKSVKEWGDYVFGTKDNRNTPHVTHIRWQEERKIISYE